MCNTRNLTMQKYIISLALILMATGCATADRGENVTASAGQFGVWMGGYSSSTVYAWVNNANEATASITLNTVSNPIHLGYDTRNGRFGDHDILEVIIYDTFLSTSDRTQVYNYLATKYGL